MSQSKLIIAVIGTGRPSPAEVSLAEEVGRELARREAVLVCGGLGGVMEAACRGAVDEGGITVGILPGDSPDTANPYVTIPVVTGMRNARNVVVVKSARAVIAVGGGYGTLSEIAHALQNDIPVIGIDTWHISRNDAEDGSIVRVNSPGEAVEKAIIMAGRREEE
jgi:uncharacterized protein (TIGR00725 family)